MSSISPSSPSRSDSVRMSAGHRPDITSAIAPELINRKSDEIINLSPRELFNKRDVDIRARNVRIKTEAFLQDARRYRNFGWIPVVGTLLKTIETGAEEALRREAYEYNNAVNNADPKALNDKQLQASAEIMEKIRTGATRQGVSEFLSFIPVLGWAVDNGSGNVQKIVRKRQGILKRLDISLSSRHHEMPSGSIKSEV